MLVLVILKAAQAGSWVLEGSDRTPDGWLLGELAPGGEPHELAIAVSQRNLGRLQELLEEVSTPGSPRRGQYWTYHEAQSLTANPAATAEVLGWLQGEVGAEIMHTQRYGLYIRARANVSSWERALGTRFAHFTSEADPSQEVLRATAGVSLPDRLAGSVAGLFGATLLSPRTRPPPPVPVGNWSRPGLRASSAITHVEPTNLKSFYDVRGAGGAKATQSVYASIDQNFSPSDLESFQKQFGLSEKGVGHVIGGHDSDGQCLVDSASCDEANLDVQYLTAMSPKGSTTFWYEQSDFYSWIMEVADTPEPPLVHSISYGQSEPGLPQQYVTLFNNEAMKLGVQGVTIVVSSGDDGALSSDVRQGTENCGYTPDFPASSPYVTSVGATQGGINGGNEVVCSSETGAAITSGGGFSTKFSTPKWQKAAIQEYFSKTGRSFPDNAASGGGRGYPDLSMAGHSYQVVIGGKTYLLDGTSASAPVVAGLASLVNAALLEAGKPPIGFMNPVIYSNGTSAFNDITSGENKCAAVSNTGQVFCCAEGYDAASGWDPTTGWGSVDFPKFWALFSDLPLPLPNPWWMNPSEWPLWLWVAGLAALALLGVALVYAGRACQKRRLQGRSRAARPARVPLTAAVVNAGGPASAWGPGQRLG